MQKTKLRETRLASDCADPQMLNHPERASQGGRQSPPHVPSSLLFGGHGSAGREGWGRPQFVWLKLQVQVACPGGPGGPLTSSVAGGMCHPGSQDT